MAETEVETILREIRERVLSQQAAAPARTTGGSEGNGASDSGPAQQMAQGEDAKTVASENLALINSYLTTTARAWDRLPPLVSNRSGVAARLELWVKRHLKRATRWYAWEQVNFNAAVHHALSDMLAVLAAYERDLARLRTEAANGLSELEALRAAIETERQARSAAEARIAELISELRERDERLLRELRERDEHLRDEQRVSLKQLSLETSEAAVLEDRARRKTEALLKELTHRLEQLEK
ncbi:MAG TPA: hypothetical protein VGJ55_09335 [Pyrinomonadaceae bacterium]